MPLSFQDARMIALAFEEATEEPHFEITSFRIRKKIFATLNEKEGLMCIMLSPVDQDVFSAYDSENIFPVPNAWGKKGATWFSVKKVKKGMLQDALTCAYCKIAPKQLAAKYRRV